MTINAWILHSEMLGANDPEDFECHRMQDEGYALGVSLKLVYARHFELLIDGNGQWKAYYEGRVVERPAFIITRTGGLTNYAEYAVMRYFKQLGVPLYNDVSSIEITSDKLRTQKTLNAKGIPMPKAMMGRTPPNVDFVEQELGFPVVVKVINGTQGQGVVLCETKDQLRDTMGLLQSTGSQPAQIIYQRFIADSFGRDHRVFVVDGKVLACMERQSKSGSFKSNVSLGGQGTAFKATPEMERVAIAAVRELGLLIAGVDLLIGPEGPIVCEVNSAPGFKGLEKATGVNAGKAVVQACLKAYRAQGGHVAGTGLFDRVKDLLKPSKAA